MPAEGERASVHADGEGVLRVRGALSFENAAELRELGRQGIDACAGGRATLDLSAVRGSDSAGLALVVDWLRAARARGVALEIRGAPAQLVAIARVSGLAPLLEQEPTDAS